MRDTQLIMKFRLVLPCLLAMAASLSGCQFIGTDRSIHEAVRYGDLARVKELLQKDPNLVNAIKPGNGTCPIYLAAANNELEIAEVLIRHGAEIDMANESGTALHVASDEHHLEMMKLLMKNGADPVSQKNDGKLTPLHYAARRDGGEEAVRLLLAAGAKVNAKDIVGRTALHRADDKSTVALLVAYGADVNARDDKGWTSLHWAASSREIYSLETITLLLEKGADQNLKDLEGKTAAEIARESEKAELAKLLDSHR